MIKHTFFDKCCTIYKNSDSNTGLNPVAELNYGDIVSRALIHFDINELKSLYDDKTICDTTKVKHFLKLTNCGSVNNDIHNKALFTTSSQEKERASSFDVLLLKLPKFWDEGKGVDCESDFWRSEEHVYSNLGCNWYQRVNGGIWKEGGVYSTDTILNEYNKFLNNEESIIISEQHFDKGNENFNFDITDYVNLLLDGSEKNNGLLLCYHPTIETMETETQQYVGFFGPNTNTFFHPYLETVYDDAIVDNRNNFTMNKINRLYLYCHDENEYFNLDELPSCAIEGLDKEITVKQQRKGVYYVEFSIKNGEIEEDTILVDKWFNLSLNGEKLNDQEFEFVVLKNKNLFSIKKNNNTTYIPSLTGIIADEKLHIGENRTVELVFRQKYTTNICEIFEDCFYRLYVKDGVNEIEVLPYHPIDKESFRNVFTINTNDLIPNTYYIDIRYKNSYYKDVLRFKVINDFTHIY